MVLTLMIDNRLTVIAAGTLVMWAVMLTGFWWRERESDRQNEIKMAFVMSVIVIGLWAVFSLLVVAIGWLLFG